MDIPSLSAFYKDLNTYFKKEAETFLTECIQSKYGKDFITGCKERLETGKVFVLEKGKDFKDIFELASQIKYFNSSSDNEWYLAIHLNSTLSTNDALVTLRLLPTSMTTLYRRFIDTYYMLSNTRHVDSIRGLRVKLDAKDLEKDPRTRHLLITNNEGHLLRSVSMRIRAARSDDPTSYVFDLTVHEYTKEEIEQAKHLILGQLQ